MSPFQKYAQRTFTRGGYNRTVLGRVIKNAAARRIQTFYKKKVKGHTKTATHLLGKLTNESITHQPGEVSFSSVRYPSKPQLTYKQFNLMKKETGELTYVYNIGQKTAVTGVGAQLANSYENGAWYRYADLSGMLSVAGTASATSQSTATMQIYCHSLRAEVQIANPHNVPVEIELYDVKCRKDIAYANYVTPYLSWSQGMVDQNQNNMDKQIGSNPFQCKAFTEFWRVIKITKIHLPPGGVHIHRVSYPLKRFFNNEVLTMLANSGTTPRGTGYTMICYRGLPIDDTANKNTVTTASVQLAVIWKKQYIFYAPQPNRSLCNYSSALATTLTNVDAINEETGAEITSLVTS